MPSPPSEQNFMAKFQPDHIAGRKGLDSLESPLKVKYSLNYFLAKTTKMVPYAAAMRNYGVAKVL